MLVILVQLLTDTLLFPWQQEVFVRNALHIPTYCPTLRDEVLALVVMKMIKFDVSGTGKSKITTVGVGDPSILLGMILFPL